MAYRTPLSRVEGLGSAHSGFEPFWRLRITAAILIPLTLWFGISVLALAGSPREDVFAYFHSPVPAVLMVFFIFALTMHMWHGIKEVIEDYVPEEGLKLALLALNSIFVWAIRGATLFAMYRIAL